ncbi:4-oxalocrotonate tautomerase [Streptomyces spiroverticillatus]|uniref:4-oxalocrotonate tautomerase n=1 Tax=Streptomyces finlayi TaxID=67296 RepID=A0A918X6V6_9ACTN|nr:tautomerase family protein [Streptomyces finlayi]GHA30389.1 4-oxalocrotonate tautomerase [Streptomyces spiroverticillatus]GHD14876.1 4-oxalocrotonate tautomerase [Streptomyces finlayi]
MPLIRVTLLEGRSPQEVAALGAALTAAAHETLGTPAEAVRVIVEETPPDRWFVGGRSMAERRSTSS